MKNLIKISTLMLLAALFFAGCKKDEDVDKDYGKAVVGEYVGTLALGVPLTNGTVLTLTRVADDKVTVSLNETLTNLPNVGTLPLRVTCDATVTKSNKLFLVSGEKKVSIPELGGEFPVGISGSISDAGVADFNIQIQMSSEITSIVSVEFKGTKKK